MRVKDLKNGEIYVMEIDNLPISGLITRNYITFICGHVVGDSIATIKHIHLGGGMCGYDQIGYGSDCHFKRPSIFQYFELGSKLKENGYSYNKRLKWLNDIKELD